MRRALRVAAWVLAFVVLLLLCVRLTFPTGALARMAEVRLSEALGATDVKIGELSLLGLIPGGVELEDVQVSFPDVALKTDTPGKDRKVGRSFQADRLAIEASLGGLLGGEVDASFEGELMGGAIEGGRVIVPKDGVAELRIATIRDINLGTERLFAATTGFDVSGVLSGSLDLQVPVSSPEGKLTPKMSGLSGQVELTIADTRIDDPVVERNQMRQALTDVTLGMVTLKLRAGDGASPQADAEGERATRPEDGGEDKRRGGNEAAVLHLEEISASGPDLQLAVGPRAAVTFRPGKAMGQAALRAHFAVRIDEAFIGREVDDPKAPGKKARPNGALKLILEDLTRKGHVADGEFGLTLTGPLSKPTITTEKPRIRAGGSGGAAGRRMKVEAGDEPGEGDAGADANPIRPGGMAPRPAINRPAVGGGRPIPTTPLGGGPRGSFEAGRPTMPTAPPSMPPSPSRMPEPEPDPGLPEEPGAGPDDPSAGGGEEDPGVAPEDPPIE
jgi:type II secretion system protein N